MLSNLPTEIFNNVPMTCWRSIGESYLYCVNTLTEWKAFYEILAQQKLVACDTETTGFQWFKDHEVIGLSFGWKDQHFYIPLRHSASVQEGPQEAQIDILDIKDDLIEFFSDKTKSTIWHNCMHASSEVLLADGTKMKIDKMVKDKHPGPVLCLNEETGQLESKRVVNWLKGDLRPNEEWLRISFASKGVVSCTIDHEIITSRGRVTADSLMPGDKVVTALPNLAGLRSFLFGTLLGDASISLQKTAKAKTPHITIAHCIEDLAYVEWKRSILSSLCPSTIVISKNNRGFGKPTGQLSKFTTSTDARLHDIFATVAPTGTKSLNVDWIAAVDVPAVAMWYCDAGHIESGNYPVITSTVPASLREALANKLNNLGFSIRYRDVEGAGEDVCRIYLSSGSPTPVWDLLCPWIPACMARKTPVGSVVATADWNLFDTSLFAETVASITPLFQKNGRDGISRKFQKAREYCIAVEDNKNFFVNAGFCVSNCKFDMHFYKREGIDILCKIHDTRILWHFFDENAPGALKVIASGWKDELGRWHKGIVDGAASVKEKQLSEWRTRESRLRRDLFRKLVMAEADIRCKQIEFQHMKRNELKKHIAKELVDHEYAKSGKEDIHYGFIPISLMTEYAALDTYLTYRVYEYCVRNITWTQGLTALYKNEMNLLLALFEAEEHGMRVSRAHLMDTGRILDERIAELTTIIKAELGDINLKSVQQLAEALQDKGVKLTKATESTAHLDDDDEDKKYVLDKKVLEKLKSKHEIVKAILSLREVLKTKNTYVDGILEKINDEDVLHCSFNQNVATGRMSSQDPNLQNIPARNKSIRKAFVPWNDEYIYVFADYSQIEVRLTAHYSQDPLLLDAYRKNQDVHTRTFCEMWGLDVEEVSEILKDENHPMYKEYSALRGVAKRINFGIIYGVGAPGLSEQIERPSKYKDASDDEWVGVCQGYIDQYLDKYIGVRQFVAQGKALVARDLQVTNYFGRVRHLPHANIAKVSRDKTLRWMEARAARQGVNFLVQGCQDPSAPVLTTQGYVPLNKLEELGKPPLVTYTGTEENYTVLDTGEKESVEVVTSISTGICSTEHKFFVLDPATMDLEFKSICDLTVGQQVVAIADDVYFPDPKKQNFVPHDLVAALCTVLKRNEYFVKLPTFTKRWVCLSTVAIKTARKCTRERALNLLDLVGAEEPNLRDLLKLDWATILEINPKGVLPTMDLELHGEDHSYICRGLVQHNTAADLFKVAVVRIRNILKGKKSKLVNFVHDEVQIYMHKSEMDLLPAIKKAMEDWKFAIDIIAEFSYSETSWGDKKSLHF